MLLTASDDPGAGVRALALRTGIVFAAIAAALALMPFASPEYHAAGKPAVDIVQLQLAGTRDAALNLLRLADPRLVDALAWDLALIAVYTAGLFFGLRMFARAVHGASPPLIDRVAPWGVCAAAVCDLVQDALLFLELRASTTQPPDWLDWVPGVVASLTLAILTLLLVACTRLAWLVMLDFARATVVRERVDEQAGG